LLKVALNTRNQNQILQYQDKFKIVWK
jgi:hypothetical protein